MAIEVVAGPAGAGKSDWIHDHSEPGAVVVDFTRLWRALFPKLADAVRGDEHREQLRVAQWVKMAALRRVSESDLDGFVTTSDPAGIDEILHVTGGDRRLVRVIDPGRDVVLRRLAKSQPGRERACTAAVARWYGRR